MSGHPFESNFSVLNFAFDALNNQNKEHGSVLRQYKGVNGEAWEMVEYEKQRIEEVRFLMKRLLEEYYKNNTIK